MINKEKATQWIEALRSGKYLQGKGALCRKTDGQEKFCCLGVYCDIQKFPYEWSERNSRSYKFDTSFEYTGILGASVRDELGLTNQQMDDLIFANDKYGQSFTEIADRIQGWLDEQK